MSAYAPITPDEAIAWATANMTDAQIVRMVGEAIKERYRGKTRRVRGPRCEVCGATDDLQVHHVDGFRVDRTIREGFASYNPNERSNLQTLCRKCHGTK